jgi:hypothetical protein
VKSEPSETPAVEEINEVEAARPCWANTFVAAARRASRRSSLFGLAINENVLTRLNGRKGKTRPGRPTVREVPLAEATMPT